MYGSLQQELMGELDGLREARLYKGELVLESPQSAHVEVEGMGGLLNLCANNYLGLADHPAVIEAARDALERWGFGMASVRFICGTQTLHKQLEERLSEFLGTEDTILFSSCFDANGGLFEALLGPDDAVISDALNHASIIDGIRLCKAARLRYANGDLDELEARLDEAAGAHTRMIATDGVFSMDGHIADLAGICDLAERHDALVMVDDSHAVGFVGPNGRGTPELHGVTERVDIVTGTLGKAMGGASGGYVSGRREIVELLRQRARPYLFSNSVAPPIAAAGLKAIELVEGSPELRDRLWANTARFRAAMTEAGFDIVEGTHPIVPVMLGDAAVSARFAERLWARGVYAISFSFPVVPAGHGPHPHPALRGPHLRGRRLRRGAVRGDQGRARALTLGLRRRREERERRFAGERLDRAEVALVERRDGRRLESRCQRDQRRVGEADSEIEIPLRDADGFGHGRAPPRDRVAAAVDVARGTRIAPRDPAVPRRGDRPPRARAVSSGDRGGAGRTTSAPPRVRHHAHREVRRRQTCRRRSLAEP